MNAFQITAHAERRGLNPVKTQQHDEKVAADRKTGMFRVEGTLRVERVLVNIVGKAAQTGAALWIFNVWFLRFNKDTGYRGGDATNMVEEFDEYGLSKNTMYVVGAAKVSLATLMLIGLWVPKLVRPASGGLAALMLGAIGMHVKVKDPLKRSLPALSVFSLSVLSAVLNGPESQSK